MFYSSWGRKESDMTERLNGTELPDFLCLEPNSLMLTHVVRYYYKGLPHNEYLDVDRTDVKSSCNICSYLLPILTLLSGASPQR